jgi:hypothetical protein
VLSLALDPFFQQLVSYPQRSSSVDRGTVPRSVMWLAGSNIFQNKNFSVDPLLSPDPALVSPIDEFMANDGPFTIPQISPFCASNDCSWPIFDTLGVCSECADVSSMLQFGCMQENGFWRSDWVPSTGWTTNVSLTSCGYFFNATGPKPMLMSGQ